jgi:hypothetical protein
MSSDCSDTPYTRFVGGLSDKLALAPAEADALLRSLRDAPQHAPADPLDHTELLLAVSLNAQIRNAHDDARCKKLKFLLRNNNDRAITIATQWIDQKVTFEAMLAAV